MYGTGIGTGASGVALFAGLTLGSWVLVAVAVLALTVMVFTLARNTRRRKAHQRP
jgi:membrane protein implicated in regulation of membrane protease activity